MKDMAKNTILQNIIIYAVKFITDQAFPFSADKDKGMQIVEMMNAFSLIV